MPAVTPNGLTIEYEEYGKKEDPAMILIMGLGNQLTAWPEDFVSGLAEQGFRVIIFDNRDVGLSGKLAAEKAPNILTLMLLSRLGIRLPVPYTLEEMALDTVGLMDALGIGTAHIAGVSMGGMIAQILAARHRDRVQTLTGIITSSGNPRLPGPKKEVARKMLKKPQNRDQEAWFNYYVEIFTMIGSPGADPEELRKKVQSRIDRCLYPEGTTRQLAAIIHSGSRVKLLKEITAPTLVISGSVDPLVPYQCGQDIAANVKGGRFELIEGLGHDLPDHLIPQIVDLIAAHAKQAT